MKTYNVRVTYEGTITANDKEELENILWVTHYLFGNPYENVLFDAVEIEIEGEEE